MDVEGLHKGRVKLRLELLDGEAEVFIFHHVCLALERVEATIEFHFKVLVVEVE